MGRIACAPEGGRQSRVRNELLEALFPLGFNLPSELEVTLRSAPARGAPGALHGKKDFIGVRHGRGRSTVTLCTGSESREVYGTAFPSS